MGSTLYVSSKCPVPGSPHNPTLGFSRRRMMVINLVMMWKIIPKMRVFQRYDEMRYAGRYHVYIGREDRNVEEGGIQGFEKVEDE